LEELRKGWYARPALSAAPLKLLYSGMDYVAIDKPSGLSVHRGPGDRIVAMTLLRDQLGRWVYPIHRLDRATSGVLLFALSSETASKFSRLFAEGQVAKTYLAICRGVLPEQGRIDHPVPGDEDGARVPAVTNYRKLWDNGKYSLLEARPETGRYHQIRRHLKHLSHPLIGDVRYGKGEHNRFFREHYQLSRLALHASRLRFVDPEDGTARELSAQLPEDLRATLEALGVPPSLLSD
jgi:tRNA pseudouridine65 synthase